MARSGAYGQSFALKHLENGELDAALAEANQEIARDPEDPEAMLDRAQVHLALERFAETVADIEACRALDRAMPILDDALVDDTLFSALVGWSKQLSPRDPEGAVAVIARYAAILPDGSHSGEAASWVKRFRGQTEMWVKPRS